MNFGQPSDSLRRVALVSGPLGNSNPLRLAHQTAH